MHKQRVLYFGCWSGAGHYLHTPDGRTHWPRARTEEFGPWTPETIDGCLQPGCEWDERRKTHVHNSEPQGVGRLHHQDGWTALAFWDRTADTRPGCNATFIAEGTHDEPGMRALAEEHFPRIWARMRKAWEVPSA